MGAEDIQLFYDEWGSLLHSYQRKKEIQSIIFLSTERETFKCESVLKIQDNMT